MKKAFIFALLVLLAASPLLAASSYSSFWDWFQSVTGGGSSSGGSSDGSEAANDSSEDNTTNSTDSETVGTTVTVKTTLSAGKAGGIFVGFSKKAYPDIEAITEVELKFDQPSSMDEIIAKDQNDLFAYWIFKPMDSTSGFGSNYTVYLSWEDSDGIKGNSSKGESLFTVYSDSKYENKITYAEDAAGYKLAEIVKGGKDSVYKSMQIFVKTGDLRKRIYGEKCSLTLSMEVKTT